MVLISSMFVTRKKYNKLLEEQKESKKVIDIYTELLMQIYGVIDDWNDNKMGNLRAISTIYSIFKSKTSMSDLKNMVKERKVVNE
jgi:hypothetical protein